MAERRVTAKPAAEPDFLQFNDLACETVGGKVIFATDEWFAPAKNLLKREPPQFIPSAFTEFGKWMDGWETRRKRIPGHDWCIIQLGVAGFIHGLDVDTSFFTGNHSPYVSIQATCLDELPPFTPGEDRTGMAATGAQIAAVAKLSSEVWPELLGESALQPGYADCCHNYFRVSTKRRVTHLRLNMYPDGGIARLKVFGIGQRDWSSVPTNQDVDLVALTNGGVCLGYSDAHFGHPRNMIGLGRGANMADGWETARRSDRPKTLKADQRGILQVPGWEWAVFRLGRPGLIGSIEVDTNHFKGNFPDSCRIEACLLTAEDEARCIQTRWNSGKWEVLLPPQKLRPHHRHQYSKAELMLNGPVSHVRLIIAPDGGVSRLRLWGRPMLVPGAPANQNRPPSKL
ncbi:probable allantoicase [Xiphophorus maculatus]|uniref:Allantoate amidinohydrolase n=1 Tax=Xiphophorus maculatus TaxID=8083 RepID=A0A3B5QYG2_XIPMA|nr:probable allantoicase [Xiphophorus maculatus]